MPQWLQVMTFLLTAPVAGVVVGVLLTSRVTNRRDAKQALIAARAAEVDDERKRRAAAESWARERRNEAHAEVLQYLRRLQRQLAGIEFSHTGVAKKHTVPWLDLTPLDTMKARLEILSTPETVRDIDHIARALLNERRALMTEPSKRQAVERVDAGVELSFDSYIERVRLELGQPVDEGRYFSAVEAAETMREHAREKIRAIRAQEEIEWMKISNC